MSEWKRASKYEQLPEGRRVRVPWPLTALDGGVEWREGRIEGKRILMDRGGYVPLPRLGEIEYESVT